jgi:hypothetical protein
MRCIWKRLMKKLNLLFRQWLRFHKSECFTAHVKLLLPYSKEQNMQEAWQVRA